jgi:phosphomannomutase/phosphoglucomutase
MTQIKMEKRLFGTNGVRGVTGKDMTPALALSIGMALGSMRKGKIAVGMDTRTSGPALASAVKAGLLATGCDVIDCGILPTPALQYLVKNHFDGGAVITASHNPPEYNGVKIIEADGTEMGDAETILLEERIFSQNFDTADWQRVGREVAAPAMVDEYIDAVVAAFPPGIGNGMTVIADPGCGAAAVTTPRILSRLGCRVMTINSQIDGTFPGRLPEPSVEGLKGLTDLVRSSGAAFGVAHDGDADRAVFIDETGRYIEENQEFGLIEQEVCSSRTGAVVTPVSSSRLIEAIAEKNGCHVVYTPVGSIYVARTMIGLLEKGEAVAFGGEGNGGLIYPDHQFCRDGGMTAAMMVAILSRTGKPLSTLVENLPVFFMIKDKVRVKDPEALIMQMKQAFASDRLDLTDGVRINRGDTWALIRPSGTEPLVRIMVESGQKESADALYQEIIRQIRS